MSIELLSSYVAEQIDAVEVNFQELEKKYPALSFALGDNQNEIAIKILEGALVKCSWIKYIETQPHHPMDRILRSIPHFIFHRLKSIKIFTFEEKLNSIDIPGFKGKSELTADESPLHFLYVWHDHRFNLTVKCNHIRQAVSALNTVLKATALLKLSTLDLSNNAQIGGNLSMLFSHCFPSLQTLILSNCRLQLLDTSSLACARREARLPQLRHLDVSCNCKLSFTCVSNSGKCLLSLLFQQGIPTLNTLVVRKCQLLPDDMHTLYAHAGRTRTFLSELIILDMSFNQTIGTIYFTYR